MKPLPSDLRARASRHPRWQRGRIIASNGYVKVRVGRTHPLADTRGYAYEHLVVWVSAGNPRPTGSLTLHHRNGDRTDNRLENLEPIDRATHAQLHSQSRPRDRAGRYCVKPEGAFDEADK